MWQVREVDLGRPGVARRPVARPTQQEALAVRHRERLEGIELLARLDPLGDEPQLALDREVAHAGDQRLAGGLGVDAADQVEVDLHEVRGELQDVAEAGVAGAGIVDREADGRSEPLELAAQSRVVVDLDVLGDLEDDRPLDGRQDLAERAGPDELGRDVEAEVAAGGRRSLAPIEARRQAVSRSIPRPARAASPKTTVG